MGLLILMRHAKSSWDTGQSDHERPLASRGRRDGEAAGGELAARGVHPDLVLCSTAVRTRQTWEQLQAGGVSGTEARYVTEIYQASPEDLLEIIHDVPDQVGTLLLIGHAPGVPDLAVDLVGGSDLDPDRFSTSALAVLETDGPWSALATAELREFLVPRG